MSISAYLFAKFRSIAERSTLEEVRAGLDRSSPVPYQFHPSGSRNRD